MESAPAAWMFSRRRQCTSASTIPAASVGVRGKADRPVNSFDVLCLVIMCEPDTGAVLQNHGNLLVEGSPANARPSAIIAPLPLFRLAPKSARHRAAVCYLVC